MAAPRRLSLEARKIGGIPQIWMFQISPGKYVEMVEFLFAISGSWGFEKMAVEYSRPKFPAVAKITLHQRMVQPPLILLKCDINTIS